MVEEIKRENFTNQNLENENILEREVENIEINLLEENEKNEEINNSLNEEENNKIRIPKPKKVEVEKRGTEYKTIATYPYKDKEGKTIFEIEKRSGPGQPYLTKYQKNKNEEPIYRLPRDIEIPIYNLPKVIKGIEKGRPIWVLEGESKVDVMTTLGFIATTVPYKSPYKWNKKYNKFLEGAKSVIVFYDNDKKSKDFKEHTILNIGEDPNFENVYEVGVKDFFKDIKEEGDIKDLVEALGEEKTKVTLQTFEDSL